MSTLHDDIAHGGIFTNFRREVKEIEEFYLSQDEREVLQKKRRPWRWAFVGWWILKNSILRLTPLRRVLLVIGLVLALTGVTIQNDGGEVMFQYRGLGVFCFLLVIILELKDKLLAHSELESGRAVQKAMSPDSAPSVPGWKVWLFTRSANEVGGDLVDFLRMDDGRYGVAIGDVAGKGLGAALFMVKIQSTIRALAPEFESLSDLASKLNSILMRDGIPGKFASLMFVRMDSSSGRLRFVNAGHMPPLVVSTSGLSELPKGNPALGLSAQTQFEERDLTLETGQSLFIYSDGLTEAQNERRDFYGLERVKRLCNECSAISAQSFGERVLQSVSAFEGEARRTDDLSLVILQKTA